MTRIQLTSLQLQQHLDPANVTRFRERASNSVRTRIQRTRNVILDRLRRVSVVILPTEDLASILLGEHERAWSRFVLDAEAHAEGHSWLDNIVDATYLAAITKALRASEPDVVAALTAQPVLRPGVVETLKVQRRLRKLAPPVRLSRQAVHAETRAMLKARQHVFLRRVGRQARHDLGEAIDELVGAGVRDPDTLASVITTVDRRATHAEARRRIRTELTRADSEATLAVFRQRGVAQVAAKVEWRVQPGASRTGPCARCAAMQGKVFRLEEASGLIPLHDNCVCLWVPTSRTRIATRTLPPELAAARENLDDLPLVGRPAADPQPRRIARRAAERALRRRRAA